MNENILDFYKNKTKNEQDELKKPYNEIMDSKMARAKEVSDKIILNEEYIVSLWKKIINDFVENRNRELLIENLTFFIKNYFTDYKWYITYNLYDYIGIEDLIINVENKKKVNEYIKKINELIEYDKIFYKETQRSSLNHRICYENILVLKELKMLKSIIVFEDFKELFSNGFDVNADQINSMLNKYIENNNEVILQKNIKELYESL